jgi:hypothetical protein
LRLIRETASVHLIYSALPDVACAATTRRELLSIGLPRSHTTAVLKQVSATVAAAASRQAPQLRQQYCSQQQHSEGTANLRVLSASSNIITLLPSAWTSAVFRSSYSSM